MQSHKRKKFVTILTLSVLLLLAVGTLASSLFLNTNKKTQSAKASEAVGSCIEYPEGSKYPNISNTSGYKWKAFCSTSYCTANDYAENKANSQCNKILASQIAALNLPADQPTWCYGFGGEKNSTEDWRCMLFIPPPISPQVSTQPINSNLPVQNPTQQPPAGTNNCSAKRPPISGNQPTCTVFGGSLVEKSGHLWRISDCINECTTAGAGEWCYGFGAKEKVKNHLMKYVGPVGTCTVTDIPGELSPIEQTPSNVQESSVREIQPVVEQSVIATVPPKVSAVPKISTAPQTAPAQTGNDCTNNGFFCQEITSDHTGYQAKNLSCGSTTVGCYEKLAVKNLCENNNGICSDVCDNTTRVKSPDIPLNNSCDMNQNGRFFCCVPKSTTVPKASTAPQKNPPKQDPTPVPKPTIITDHTITISLACVEKCPDKLRNFPAYTMFSVIFKNKTSSSKEQLVRYLPANELFATLQYSVSFPFKSDATRPNDYYSAIIVYTHPTTGEVITLPGVPTTKLEKKDHYYTVVMNSL